MPSLIVTCFVLFVLYPWETCSFMKGNGGIVDLGEKGAGLGRGWEKKREGNLWSGCNI